MCQSSWAKLSKPQSIDFTTVGSRRNARQDAKQMSEQLNFMKGGGPPPGSNSGEGGGARQHGGQYAYHGRPVPQKRKSGVTQPYADIRIMRTERIQDISLSVDCTAKKMQEELLDGGPKRCRLCNETLRAQASQHATWVTHTAREAIAFELLRGHQGTPDEVARMFWYRLDNNPQFQRIPSLSSPDHEERRRKLIYLLTFLKDRRVIKECFEVTQAVNGTGAGRSWEFERLEWIGDQAIKWMFGDRINTLFPLKEGGIRGELGVIQNMIDGNNGLASSYDHFGFEALTGSDKVVSKFKSDVVEAMFGEMQVFLWSTEADYSPDSFALPMGSEFLPLRSLVKHAMEEVAHCMVMQHILNVCGIVNELIAEKGFTYTRADPESRAGWNKPYSLNLESLARPKRKLNTERSQNHGNYGKQGRQQHSKQQNATASGHKPVLGGLKKEATKATTGAKNVTVDGKAKHASSPVTVADDLTHLPWVSRAHITSLIKPKTDDAEGGEYTAVNTTGTTTTTTPLTLDDLLLPTTGPYLSPRFYDPNAKGKLSWRNKHLAPGPPPRTGLLMEQRRDCRYRLPTSYYSHQKMDKTEEEIKLPMFRTGGGGGDGDPSLMFDVIAEEPTPRPASAPLLEDFYEMQAEAADEILMRPAFALNDDPEMDGDYDSEEEEAV